MRSGDLVKLQSCSNFHLSILANTRFPSVILHKREIMRLSSSQYRNKYVYFSSGFLKT